MKFWTMTNLLICLGSAASVAALASTGEVLDSVPEDPRVSVEIPLDGPLRVEGADLLRVNELLEARTEFAVADFRLREVVLLARSEAETAGEAELLIMDWRSGEFEIPAAAKDEWYEVRLPAPEEDVTGAWLLDLLGDLTVDMLVAVLEPRPTAAAKHSSLRARTVYRVVDNRPTEVITRWVHSPSYYRVYHYHHGWPYRYYWGEWRYSLAYRHARPHRKHGHRHHRKLRRVHPRLRADRTFERRHRTHDHTGRRGEARRHSHRDSRNTRSARRQSTRSSATASAAKRAPDARARNNTTRRDVARPLPTTRDFDRRATSSVNNRRDASATARGATRTVRVPRATHGMRPNAGATNRPTTDQAKPSSLSTPRRTQPRQRATVVEESPRRDAWPNQHARPADAIQPGRAGAPHRATPPQRREFVRAPAPQRNAVRRESARPPAPQRAATQRRAPARSHAPPPAARMESPDQEEARRSRRPSRSHRPEQLN